MTEIPEELLEQIERKNVLILAGEGINQDVLPTTAELVDELAERCEYPTGEGKTFACVAGYYELTTHNRPGLIDFLRDRLDRPGLKPSTNHIRIIQLAPRVLVTTCYDRLLEHAAREMGIEYTPVVGNADVAYSDDQKMLLVWLWGMLDRPQDPIVITDDDHRQFLAGREHLNDLLRRELARRTWLFLGSDLEIEWFRNFYDSVTPGLDRHRRPAYIVGTKFNAYTRAWWSERAHILPVGIEIFLVDLKKQLEEREELRNQRDQDERTKLQKRHPPDEPISEPLPLRPYKKLDYYTASDKDIFFGREHEIRKLASLIHSHRLVLLYGASGTGKTSLLRAGVLPRLNSVDSPYETIYVRARENPERAIRNAVQRHLPKAELLRVGSMVEFLDAAAQATGCTLVIVLDQFEEFFMKYGPMAREQFIAELVELYDIPGLPVKVVFSLREDWLASMVSEIEERIPYLRKTRLLPLSRKQAIQVIRKPVEKLELDMSYAEDLVERLLDDLEAEPVNEQVSSQSARVMPPLLQLVCNDLYNHAREQKRNDITMADYETMGGARDILARHIQESLREHKGPEREAARQVLKALVTSQKTKAVRNQADIIAEVGAPEAVVGRVLSRLVRQGWVRRLDEGSAYELVHDVLATSIAGWFSEEEHQLKQAQEMLHREMSDWQQNPAVFLSQGKFQCINDLRDGLELCGDEAAFLLKAAIRYDQDVVYWLEQVSNPDQILLEMLGTGDYPTRLNAARYLARFSQDEVAAALAHRALEDPEATVRDVAAASLARTGSSTGIDLLIKTAENKDSAHRAEALHALALIQEAVPGRLAGLPGRTRRQIAIALLKIRWPRIRSVTVAGAVGGALGFGFGLAPVLAWQATIFGGVLLLVFIIPLFAVSGLAIGALLALGNSSGELLLSNRPKAGRILGGILLGGLASAVMLIPEATLDSDGLSAIIMIIVGGWLLGMLLGLGVTVPSMVTRSRTLVLAGAAVGGALGVFAWGILGSFEPFQPYQATGALTRVVGTLVLLGSGGLAGVILAFSISSVEARWPEGGQKQLRVRPNS